MARRRVRRNIEMGFFGGDGRFHPIRASSDYSRKRAGDDVGALKRVAALKRSATRKAKAMHNPVRRVKGSTGWLKAKSVRIVRQAGRTVVQVKR